jgi:hypothetical protein
MFMRGNGTVSHRLKTIGSLDGSPYFYFSKYPVVNQDAIVSLTTFMRLSHNHINSMDRIPMQSMQLKLRSDVTNQEIDDLIDEIQSLIVSTRSEHVFIWDYREAIMRALLGLKILSLLFNFATVIVMLICFFNLLSSMYANINEQVCFIFYFFK